MFSCISSQYIASQLVSFAVGSHCCQLLCGSFRPEEHKLFVERASELGLYARPYAQNGLLTIKLYKNSCRHYLKEAMCLHLQPNSSKDLFLLQYNGDFVSSQHEMQMSPNFFSPGGTKPTVPPHRFTIGPIKQSMARQNHQGQQSFQRTCPRLLPYKRRLLEAVNRCRVLVVNGPPTYEKSTALPMYIIEQCGDQHSHCKIICVEREQLVAVYNSERLADHLCEKVGNTVAFQVHLQSRISESSNLIYTTASFLLRVLMGQNIIDSFRHVSHVIVSDVHAHEAFADLLLCELRTALECYAHLRVVLLSNSHHNDEFLQYFGEGEEFQLDINHDLELGSTESNCSQHEQDIKKPSVLYINEIRKLFATKNSAAGVPRRSASLAYAAPPSVFRELAGNQEQLDRCLEDYERSGTDQSFEAFLYMIKTEYGSINYRHSICGSTAVIIAAKLGSAIHLRTLLQLHADPFIMDEQNLNAISSAVAGGSTACIDMLNEFCGAGNTFSQPKDANASHFDYTLITDLIRLLCTNCEWTPGNILVFVPGYDQLIKLNFSILRQKLIGNIPQQISVNVLHSNIEKDQLESLIAHSANCIKIILATDIAETIIFMHSISYVIDSARTERVVYYAETCTKEIEYDWISKENLESRTSLVCCVSEKRGTCFRLITSSLFDKLPEVNKPELLTMSLDRVCLTVKLLSQYTHAMVAEYFRNTIVQPPFLHVLHTVEYLKKIDIFDEMEDVTWLGCRLIDVPVSCQLGKLLVFAILLQCLDPVLTIVSFLTSSDPLELPRDIDGLLLPYITVIRNKIKKERMRLAEGIHSDHLMYLRLFQEWQNNLRDDCPEMALLDEHHFMLNGILEKVCNMRTHLVGALRSSQLIHNQGQLSMHYINLKSNSWPMIKAALVGGLYPKICFIDSSVYRLKSTGSREVVLHPSSVLRELSVEPLVVSVQNFTTPWIVYGNESSSINCNSISCCTLVTPLSIAMFSGPTKMYPSNITTCSATDKCINEKSILTSSNAGTSVSYFYIDDWIWFTMKSAEAQLLYKTRQYFYSTYINYLQYCGSMDKWRRNNISLTQIPRLFDTIEKVLIQEDVASGFAQPDNVGLRPKAVPNKFIATFNAANSWDPDFDTYLSGDVMNYTQVKSIKNGSNTLQKLECREKQFFMVYLSESTDIIFHKYSQEWLSSSVAKVVGPYVTPKNLTFVIMYNKSPDQFCTVAVAKWSFGVFALQECFQNRVPIYELLSICLKHNIYIPSFNERRVAFQLDKKVGEIILELFAFRNNWLHNN